MEGEFTLKYRSREISSKQYGAGQSQQISDVFLKQAESHRNYVRETQKFLVHQLVTDLPGANFVRLCI